MSQICWGTPYVSQSHLGSKKRKNLVRLRTRKKIIFRSMESRSRFHKTRFHKDRHEILKFHGESFQVFMPQSRVRNLVASIVSTLSISLSVEGEKKRTTQHIWTSTISNNKTTLQSQHCATPGLPLEGQTIQIEYQHNYNKLLPHHRKCFRATTNCFRTLHTQRYYIQTNTRPLKSLHRLTRTPENLLRTSMPAFLTRSRRLLFSID